MVAIAIHYLENHDDAEDITQDALFKLWAMHEMLRESEVDRIAFAVLKHLCIDELRRREYRKGKQTLSIDSIDVAMEADNPQEIEERERQLMVAVGKLPSKQRLLLHMRYIKGKDVHTIAQITGSTEESINMALSRARNTVYKFMAVVVVAVISIGLFAFSYHSANEAPVVASVDNMENKHELVNNASDSVVLRESAEKDIVAHSPKVTNRCDAAPANADDAPEEDGYTAPAVGDNESLDRDMMQAILETSVPEKVYASQSQLPDADVSNRDRLRKKTLAIITLNE